MCCLIDGLNDDRLLNGIFLGLLRVVPFYNTFQIGCPVDLVLHTERHSLLNDLYRIVIDKLSYDKHLVPDVPGLFLSYLLTVLPGRFGICKPVRYLTYQPVNTLS